MYLVSTHKMLFFRFGDCFFIINMLYCFPALIIMYEGRYNNIMFGSKSKNIALPFDLFDIHCHIVPGVDDGAETLDDSMALIDAEYRDGVRTIILTPHFRMRMFENREQAVRDAYALLRDAVAGKYPDMTLYLGCELHEHGEMVEHIRRRGQLLMADTDFVLVEFSGLDEKSLIKERLYTLVSNGYSPIIAHMERYENVRSDFDFIEYVIGLGVRIQLNADAIIGSLGGKQKKICERLLDSGAVSFIGSDCHDMTTRPPRLGECAAYLAKRYGVELVKKLMHDNPQNIIKRKV